MKKKTSHWANRAKQRKLPKPAKQTKYQRDLKRANYRAKFGPTMKPGEVEVRFVDPKPPEDAE